MCELEIEDTIKHEDWNLVFENHREEDEIYPLTTIEIAEAQKKDQNQKVYYARCNNTRKWNEFSTF